MATENTLRIQGKVEVWRPYANQIGTHQNGRLVWVTAMPDAAPLTDAYLRRSKKRSARMRARDSA